MSEQRTKIYRNTNKENYSIIHNEVIRRTDLSWKAKGIMTYILSLPDDWEIFLEEVAKHATDGRDSFRSGWKELTDAGYVRRFPVKENGKIVSWRTEIRENVDVEGFLPRTGFPQVGKPEVGKPQVENPTLLNTNNTKDLLKLNTNNKSLPPPATNNNNINQLFQKEFGRMLSPMELETINAWLHEDNYDPEVIEVALKEAVLNQAYSFKYIDKILLTWERKGIKSKSEALARLNKKRNERSIPTEVEPQDLPHVPLINWGTDDD